MFRSIFFNTLFGFKIFIHLLLYGYPVVTVMMGPDHSRMSTCKRSGSKRVAFRLLFRFIYPFSLGKVCNVRRWMHLLTSSSLKRKMSGSFSTCRNPTVIISHVRVLTTSLMNGPYSLNCFKHPTPWGGSHRKSTFKIHLHEMPKQLRRILQAAANMQ